MGERILLSTNEAATRLGVKRTTLYQLMQEGRLRYVHIGRRRLIPVRDLEAFVNNLRSKEAA